MPTVRTKQTPGRHPHRARRAARRRPLRRRPAAVPAHADGRGQARPRRRRRRRQVSRAAGHAADDAVGLARSRRAAEGHHRLRRHRGDRDDDARAQRDPARRDDGRHRQAPPGQPRRRAALGDGPDVRQRRRARRHAGDPDQEDRAQGVRHQLPPARRAVPHRRPAGAGIPDRLRALLLPRSRQEADRVQAGRRHRPAAVPRHHRGRPRSQRAQGEGRAAHQGRQGPHQHAASVEERLQHGSQRAAGRLDALPAGLREGRPAVDRRLALPAGQRRGQPDRAGVRLPRDRAADRSCART